MPEGLERPSSAGRRRRPSCRPPQKGTAGGTTPVTSLEGCGLTSSRGGMLPPARPEHHQQHPNRHPNMTHPGVEPLPRVAGRTSSGRAVWGRVGQVVGVVGSPQVGPGVHLISPPALRGCVWDLVQGNPGAQAGFSAGSGFSGDEPLPRLPKSDDAAGSRTSRSSRSSRLPAGRPWSGSPPPSLREGLPW